MKKSLFGLSVFCLLIMNGMSVVDQDKKSKEEKKAESFSKMIQLVDSKQYRFEADFAYPTGYPAVNLASNPNYLEVRDSIADVSLPYFGRAYSVPYGGGQGGFHVKGEILNYKQVLNEKKMKYQISFDVRDGNDTYKIVMDVFASNSCSVNIVSTNRNSISYNGDVRAIPEEKK